MPLFGCAIPVSEERGRRNSLDTTVTRLLVGRPEIRVSNPDPFGASKQYLGPSFFCCLIGTRSSFSGSKATGRKSSFESRQRQSIETGCRMHVASCPLGTGVLLPVRKRPTSDDDTYIRLVRRVRMHGTMYVHCTLRLHSVVLS